MSVKNGVAEVATPEEEVSKKHNHKIWESSDGKWCTYIEFNGGRKLIRRKQRQAVVDYLIKFYKDQDEILEKYKEDFSMYKEINVWHVKPAAYLISPNGHIYSIDRRNFLHPHIDDKTDGYKGQYYIVLQSDEGKDKRFSVARLTQAMFNGLPPEDMQNPSVDHIDGDPLNNYYKNLRWVEHGDNSSLRRNRGIGEKNGRAKLTQEQVIHICNMFVRGNCSISNIAESYGVSPWTIQEIYKKNNWNYITAWYEFSPNVFS